MGPSLCPARYCFIPLLRLLSGIGNQTPPLERPLRSPPGMLSDGMFGTSSWSPTAARGAPHPSWVCSGGRVGAGPRCGLALSQTTCSEARLHNSPAS